MKRGCHVIQSPRDADVDIVKAAVERSHHCTTTLVGEDTDLLILLLHYSRTDNEVIYFRPDANKQLKERKVYNINLLKETLGKDLCNELRFIYAYSGCDSTSRIFGIDKKSAIQKLVKSDPVMKSCASAFILQNKSPEDISYLGESLMVDLFGGKSNDTLSSLRHVIFTKKVANTQAFVTSERLPPTSPATRFHSQRVYFQIMVWMGMANEMNPIEWGWKQENSQSTPIMTENNAAPEELLPGYANLLDVAVNAMDSPALLHVALAKLKTVTIQTILKRSNLKRRMMILKTEYYETFSLGFVHVLKMI